MKIKKAFNKIIKFCTDSMFYTEDELLQESLAKRIMEIKEKNSRELIEDVIMPNLQTSYLKETNLLMPEKDLYKLAVEIFIEAKNKGRIDELNNLTEEMI